MISHWIAVIGLFLFVGAAMALAWRYRQRPGRRFEIDGPGGAIPHTDHHHHHVDGDGFSSHDF